MLGFGAWAVGGGAWAGGWGPQDDCDSVAAIHRAVEGGVGWIDTAAVYGLGHAEEIVGQALKGRRDDVVLATKFHAPMDVAMGQPGGDPLKRGNSRRWIVQEVEASLRRLQTDWIDLYQVHRPEAETGLEETLSALTDLQRAGFDPAWLDQTAGTWTGSTPASSTPSGRTAASSRESGSRTVGAPR